MSDMDGVQQDTKQALKAIEPQLQFLSKIAQLNLEEVDESLRNLLEVENEISEGRYSDEEELKEKMRWLWTDSEHVQMHLTHILKLLKNIDIEKVEYAVEEMNKEEQELGEQMRKLGFGSATEGWDNPDIKHPNE